MKRLLKWTAIVVTLLLLAAASAAMIRFGPSNLIGMLRYDQREEGKLVPGDQAPDVELVALDGSTRPRLRDWVGPKPVVLIFGSFT